ncbi:HAUS augmin-like complex subunit 7 [Manis javanica]|uniref:HAUS augmin-like complex subunit 7 n=1 Tax=Manis javanica TaxID=9974 RepID=UPI003C6CEB87
MKCFQSSRRELMLRGLDDQELRNCQACAQKQLRFMDKLLGAVQSLTIGCSSMKELSRDTRKKNEVLLRTVFSNLHLQTLLTPECGLWPLDVQPILNKQSDDWQRASPSPDSEEVKVAELVKQLQESAAKLQALRVEYFVQPKQGAAGSAADTTTLEQKLRLVISDFYQLVAAFLQVYDDELRECCQHPGPYLHPCGPIVQAVYQTLTSCSQLLKAVTEVCGASMRSAAETAKQQHGEQIWWDSSSALMSLVTKIEELTQKYKIRNDTLHKGTEQSGSTKLCPEDAGSQGGQNH